MGSYILKVAVKKCWLWLSTVLFYYDFLPPGTKSVNKLVAVHDGMYYTTVAINFAQHNGGCTFSTSFMAVYGGRDAAK